MVEGTSSSSSFASAGLISRTQLKNSSYVYHMSYAHGLSNGTGPSSPLPPRTR